MKIEVKKIFISFVIIIMVSAGIALGIWSARNVGLLSESNALPSAASGPCTVKLYRKVLNNGVYAYENSPYAEVSLNNGEIIHINKIPTKLYPNDYTMGISNNNGIQTVTHYYIWDFTNWYKDAEESGYFDFDNLNCSNGTTKAYAGIAVRSFNIRTCININGNCSTQTYNAIDVMSKTEHHSYDSDAFVYNQLTPFNYVIDVNLNIGSGTVSGILADSNYNYIYKTAKSGKNVRTYKASDINYSGHTVIDWNNKYAIGTNTTNKKLVVTAVYEESATVKYYKAHYPNTSSFTVDHSEVVPYSKQLDLSLLDDEEQYYFDGWYLNSSLSSDKKANPNWTIQNYANNNEIGSSGDDNILTLYGAYKPKKVVTYKYESGNEYTKVYVRPGETTEPPVTPELGDNIFAYWQDSDGYEFDFRTPISEDMTLMVYSVPKDRILVSFETYGGTPIRSQNIAVGGLVIPPSLLPERLGYDFDGYYLDEFFTESCDFSNPITTTSTIYVKWNRQASFPYTMKYFVDGEQYQTDLKSPGSSRPIINYTVEQTGRTFNGWNTDPKGNGTSYSAGASYTKDEDVNLYAQWKKITYSIKYNSNNGSSSSTEYKNYNEKYTVKTSAPSKTGYNFTGWSDGNGKVYMPGDSYDKNEALILNAQYDGKTYTVSLSTGQTIQAKYGDKYNMLSQIEPKKEGSDFDGWYLNSSFTGDEITSESTVTTPNNHTLYAKWLEVEPIVYTITYDFNGGVDGPSDGEKNHGVDYQIPTKTPKKTGYNFSKWTVNQDGTGDSYKAGGTYTKNDNLSLYAQYNYVDYVITFDAGSGTTSSNTYYAHYNDIYGNSYTGTGSSDGKLPEATQEGYNFVSWCRDLNDLTSCVSDNTVFNLTESITLYANWNPITYTIEYNGNGATGGSTLPSTHVYNATKPLNPNGFTKTGHIFLGWTVAQDEMGTVYTNNAKVLNLTTTDGDVIELYAKWSPIIYTITFDSAGGSTIENQQVEYGNKIIKPKDPTKEGYNFAGWYLGSATSAYDFDSSVEGNVTLVAHWDEIKYTVTFNSDGGSAVTNQTVNYGGKATLPSEPTKEGYTFDGWYLGSETSPYNFDTVLTDDITLTAHWTKNTYTVTFNSDGGSSVANQTVNYGGKATLPTNPTKEGYTFDGWYLGSATSPYNFDTVLTDDITLTAHWTQITYTVTFNSDGGSNVASQTVNYGGKATLPSEPTKEGYTFDGWYLESATSAYNFNTSVTDNITLIAHWTKNTYTVTFNSNGGSAIASQTINHNAKVTMPDNPTRNGYTFKGWYTNVNLTNEFDFNTPITSNITLYAKWNNAVIDITKISDYTLLGEYLVIDKTTTSNDLTVDSEYRITYERAEGKPTTNKYVGTGDTVTVINKEDTNITKSYTVIVIGDANGDGRINSGDLHAIVSHLIPKVKLTGVYDKAADTNKDGRVNSGDLHAIVSYLLGRTDIK